MTDDISKVVREMRSRAVNLPDIIGDAMRDWADRLESATTPAEVDDTEAALRYIRDWCPDSVKDHIATLARQLAEAKEGEATRRSEVRYWFNAVGAANTRAEQAESALAAATRRVAEVEAERDELRQAAHGLRFDVFGLTTNELQATFDGKQSIAVVDMDTVAALKSALQKEPK